MNALPSYDLARLLQLSAALSLVSSVGVAPTYNLPIALYGLYAVASESGEHGRTLTAALGGSLVCDVLWLFAWRHSTRSLVVLLVLANIGVKVVAFFTSQTAGVQSSFSGDAGWSMPGSFGPLPGSQTSTTPNQQPSSYQGAYSFAADEDDEDENQANAAQTPANQQQQRSAGAGYQAV